MTHRSSDQVTLEGAIEQTIVEKAPSDRFAARIAATIQDASTACEIEGYVLIHGSNGELYNATIVLYGGKILTLSLVEEVL